MKKLFSTLVIIHIIISTSVCSTDIPAGNVSGTWSASGSPYNILGNITVPTNAILNIEPGVHVVFQGHHVMYINGTISAEGRMGDTIYFEMNDTSGFADFTIPDGSWQGIYFQNDQGNRQDTSSFKFCRITDIKTVIGDVKYRGGIMVVGSNKVVIRNSVFENNYSLNWAGALYLENLYQRAYLEVDSCLFKNNTSGGEGGAMVLWGYNAIVSNSSFIDNNGSDRNSEGGGAVYLLSSTAIMDNNLFQGNNATKYGGTGGGILIDGGSPVITNNRFYENTSLYGAGMHVVEADNAVIRSNRFLLNEAILYGGGIYIEKCNSKISNNLVQNNLAGKGGGIYLESGDPHILNNTISFNNAEQEGGGIYSTEGNPIIENTILSNNYSNNLKGHQVYIKDNFSSPDFSFSLVEGGIANFGFGSGSSFQGSYANNLETLPGFIAPPSGAGIQGDALISNLSISLSSPCINTGNADTEQNLLPALDLASENRIIHGIVDVGAYEAHIYSIDKGGSITSDETWIADTVYISANVTVLDNTTLKIAPGTHVIFNGHYKLDVRGVLLARGLPGDSIRFTVKDTTGFHLDDLSGSWDGIYFNNSLSGANGAMNDNPTSFIDYCLIDHAKSSGNGGGIYVHYFSNLEISSSRIFENGIVSYTRGGGLYLNNADILIEDCMISHNFAGGFGGAAVYAIESDFQFINSAFHGNYITDYGQGGALLVYESDVYIDGCIFTGNVCPQSYGGAICFHETSGSIIRSTFSNNFGEVGGAICSFTSEMDIINCQFINNYGDLFAGAINYYNTANNNLYNSTFANNLCGSGTGGIYYHNIGSAKIVNCILFSNVGSSPDQVQDDGELVQDILCRNTIITNGLSSTLLARGNIKIDNTVFDTLPGFIRPSAGVGHNFEGLDADWNVHIFSPAINNGSMELDSHQLTEFDLAGNKRINEQIIDIGAYENQDDPVFFIKHPAAGSKCVGAELKLSVQLSDTAIIQWFKDGELISGENAAVLNIDTLKASDAGNYMCTAYNGYGQVNSNQVFITILNPPEITLSPSDRWLKEGENAMFTIDAWGTNPIRYEWSLDDVIIQDNTSRLLEIESLNTDDEGFYKCKLSNVCGSTESDSFSVYTVPQLCIVTVDPETGDNLIVWEKKSSAPILSYNIYRESEAAGIYDLLITMPYDDLSIYTDSTADPTVQSYLYKITAIDTAGLETNIDLCKPHKTIHLIVSPDLQNSATNLQWDRYYGFDYQTYTIYRSPTVLNFDPVGSISANIYSWSDKDPGTKNHFYRIAVEKPDPCYPTGSGKKANTGPYNHSLSNMDDNKLKLGQIPPDTITLNNYSIPEESHAGTLVGKMFTTDLDSVDSHSYKFVPGEGDEDNISFTILGDLLFSSESFDFESKSQYFLRIRSTDEAGNYCEVPIIIQVLDIDETTGLPALNSGKIRAYPNPFNQATTIRFPNPDRKQYRMVLMDLSGKVVQIKENISAEEFILKRNGLENGMYVLELMGEDQLYLKIVIK